MNPDTPNRDPYEQRRDRDPYGSPRASDPYEQTRDGDPYEQRLAGDPLAEPVAASDADQADGADGTVAADRSAAPDTSPARRIAEDEVPRFGDGGSGGDWRASADYGWSAAGSGPDVEPGRHAAAADDPSVSDDSVSDDSDSDDSVSDESADEDSEDDYRQDDYRQDDYRQDDYRQDDYGQDDYRQRDYHDDDSHDDRDEHAYAYPESSYTGPAFREPVYADPLRARTAADAQRNGDEPTAYIAATTPVPPPPRQRYVPDPAVYQAPPPRRLDAARWLRGLAGVDERLLRQVWFERSRHTALGGIILGTALIAGFSMWTAINESIGSSSLVAVLPALIWFIFIISLDRALVSTMVGQGRRWGAFLMRLLLSIMFGFIIAEPLTIRIFQTAIEQHIQDERSQQLDDLRSNLLSCNTKEIATSSAPAPANCAGFLLSFDKTPIAQEQELAALRRDEAALAGTVEADGAEAARLRDMAAKECAGTAGPGLTGNPGYGPDCRDRRRDVTAFESTHPLKANADRLAALRTEITALSGEISKTQATFESTRDTLIAQRVQEEKDHQGPIGLLERMTALHELASATWALFLSTWAVRIFFILADCLPVVVKFSGGSSEYDKIVKAQAGNAVRRYQQDLQLLDDEAGTHLRKYKADLDLEVQEHRADTTMRRDDAVRRVEDRMLGSGR